MNKRELTLEGKKLFIIDDFVDQESIQKFYNSTKELPFRRQEKDFDSDEFPIFSVDFIAREFENKHDIGIKSRELLNTLDINRKLSLYRSYVNMSHYGDMEYPHRDCGEDEEGITVLYYINDNWDYTWGGETLFYSNRDSRIAVLPKPGRFLIFPGNLEHKGSPPSRTCNISRLTLALKYA